MPRKRPALSLLQTNPIINSAKEFQGITLDSSSSFLNKENIKPLFSSIDTMPENTNIEIFNKYNKAFEILQE